MKRFLLHNKAALAALLLLQTIYSAGYVGFALVIQQVVNVATAGVLSTFLWWVIFSAVYLAVFAAAMFVKSAVQSRYISVGVKKMRDALTSKLLAMQYDEFSKEDSSKYLSNLTNDVNTITKNYFESSVTVPEEIISFLLAVGAAFFINYIIALTMLGLTVLIIIVPIIFNKPMNKANLQLSEDLKNLTQILKQTFLGIDVVKNFSSEERVGRSIAKKNNALAKSNTRAVKLGAFAMNLGICIVVLLQLGTVAVSGILIIQGVLLIGALFASVQLGNNLFTPIMNISGKMTLVAGVRDLNNTIVKILHTPDEQNHREVSFQNVLKAENVRYRYEGETADTLRGVNASFERGGKYLLVGRSGSGKSTLLKLLSKMYRGYGGALTLDGVEYGAFSEQNLYRVVSVAQQRSYLFRMSVRENIDFNGTGNAERLLEAVRLSCLEEFVSSGEHGVETVIDEEVNQISGGEKLRIGLARALYKGGDILLLDEVTSALDKETAHRVEENILGLAGKTVINVSHRLQPDLLRRYDGIYIMEDGLVADHGTPDEVMARPAFQKYMLHEPVASS